MNATATPRHNSVLAVVQQHVDDAISQRATRSVLVRAPHVKLDQLGRLDERLDASLDGIAVAADAGAALCSEALATPHRATLFTATVNALTARDMAALPSSRCAGGERGA
ncbi:hypothetical protein [Pyxidicoccus xibeiensis]|uniref:hypothetical protein n=1 Tax=Pyxidicoccus xibeiensis TaxID=2906759 RepID=UPI0020A75D85|nr:hypothetical protein [Pyxidicoccus xibeiensis]MCP3145362.1 hypothetical protein [Pyxidicoccus xibeiensis]